MRAQGGGLVTDEHLLESKESVSLTRNVDTNYQEVYDENSSEHLFHYAVFT